MPQPVIMISGKDPVREAGVGHTTYVRAHALAARQAGFHPRLLVVSPVNEVVESELGSIHRVRSPWPYGRGDGIGYRQWLLWLHSPLLARAGAALARRFDSAVIVHGFGPYGGVADAIARRSGGRAVAVLSAYSTLAHEMAGKGRGLAAVPRWQTRWRVRAEGALARAASARGERRGFERARRILLNYDSVRRIVAAEYGGVERMIRLPYAPDSAFRDRPPPARSGDGVPVILAVSRHDPRKRIPTLLEALVLLAARGIAFRARLVGGGVLLHEHRRLVERMGLAGRVEVMGFVPDVMAELRAADVFALHTLQEGSGSMALLEALQTGLPGVVTAVDGLVEDVADGKEALLVPPADAPAFAAALERLVSDRALRLAMGARARATFERHFAAGPFADALGRVYAEVLAEGAHAHRRRQA
ncbi:MAG: glycosyltransferase family 4 protein [Alphaproteobacteria bacterium]